MEYFTIKDIEILTGIRAYTLRTWEQRYSLLVSQRKESLRRTYNNEDLKQLLRISFLYHNGWKMADVVALSAEEIKNEICRTEPNSKGYSNFILRMIEAAVDFNEVAFTEITEQLISEIGFENFITQICYPYLQRIGRLYAKNKIVPAQEHFTTHIIQNKIITEIDKLGLNTKEPQLLLFSPKGEHHKLPLLFIYYLLKKNGWNVVYLGADITKEALRQFTRNNNVQYLFLHLVTNLKDWDMDVYFEDLCRTFPGKTIIATGSAITPLQRNFVNLKFLKEDKEIYEFISKGQKHEARICNLTTRN